MGPRRPDYKDPFGPDYLGRKATPTQLKCWPYMRDTFGAKVALLGGKGGGKTITCAAGLIDRAQKYLGSKYFIAAATYQQAIESCATELVEACDIMNIKVIYRDKMTIDRKVHKHVYYFPDFHSVICIRSADNMDMIEGSKWDGAAIEEATFWDPHDLRTALSRLRRGVGDGCRFIAAMAEGEEFWLYEWLDQNNFKQYTVNTYENAHNLPEGYISDMEKMYPGDLGRRYLLGERVSIARIPTLPNYQDKIHRSGKLSKLHTVYDPYRVLYVSVDFNVAPCTATLWQVKPVEFTVIRKDPSTGLPRKTSEIKNVIFQVDEFEEWMSATRGLARQIREKYGSHRSGMVVIGDASGNARRPNEVSLTDWKVFATEFEGMPDVVIKKGLVVNKGRRKKKSSDNKLAKYTNPPVKDTIDNLNSLLLDADGHPGIVFLPTSRYESGGCAASCSSTRYKADGTIDETADKQEGTVDEKKKRKQTHYWDTTRYIAWYLRPPGARTVRDPSHSKSGSRYKMLEEENEGRRTLI